MVQAGTFLLCPIFLQFFLCYTCILGLTVSLKKKKKSLHVTLNIANNILLLFSLVHREKFM